LNSLWHHKRLKFHDKVKPVEKQVRKATGLFDSRVAIIVLFFLNLHYQVAVMGGMSNRGMIMERFGVME
jgi:hypothetical protein